MTFRLVVPPGDLEKPVEFPFSLRSLRSFAAIPLFLLFCGDSLLG
jgi:hypothetical protein